MKLIKILGLLTVLLVLGLWLLKKPVQAKKVCKDWEFIPGKGYGCKERAKIDGNVVDKPTCVRSSWCCGCGQAAGYDSCRGDLACGGSGACGCGPAPKENNDPPPPPPPPCYPSCSAPLCGQSNGCGGSCSNSDDGAPGAVSLNPGNGGSVTINPGQQATVSWSASNKAEKYQLELYPTGSNCAGIGAHCTTTSSRSYSFTPVSGTYYYRVRGVNTSCGTDCGSWASASFTIYGTIIGTVRLDENWNASLVGGVCTLGGAPGQKPGGGSTVSAVGPTNDSSAVADNGSYDLSVLAGAGNYTVGLTIGDPSNWICTCPESCVYGGVETPLSGLDFFVTDQKLPWFQVEGGSLHADGGNVSSRVPNTCTGACDPYLITGSSGLVSYTGSLSLGDFDVEAINQSGDEWRAQTDYQGDRTDYGYFYRILADDPTSFGVFDGNAPTASGVFTGDGSTGTIGSWSITGGQKTVILVSGETAGFNIGNRFGLRQPQFRQ